MSKSLLDPEVLKEQDELTDEQQKALQKNAIRTVEKRRKGELDGEDEDENDPFKRPPAEKDTASEKDDKVTEEDDEDESEDEDSDEKEEHETEEEKKARVEDEKAERLKGIEKARKKEEDKRSEDEKKLIQDADAEEAEAKKQEFEADVESYADRLGVSEAQARKAMEKIRGVHEKYKGNPKEMAQALYHAAAKLSQLSQRMAEQENLQSIPKQLTIQGKKLSEDETKAFFIDVYRKHNPDLSDGMDDEKVHKLAIKEFNAKVAEIRAQKFDEIRSLAEKKRADLIEALPEPDKKFAKTVKSSLLRIDDSEVASEDFELEDLLRHARGKDYHKDVKEAYERGKADAVKDKKIVGKKPEDTSGGGSSGAGGKKSSALTEDEKSEALDMYLSLDVPDQRKFELYQEYKKNISKKKKE